jgi:tetratricopeptide (TPR) repeat protein
MLVWPWPLSVDYSYNAIPLKTFADPEVWIAILICLGLGAVAFLGFRKRRVASFAVLWFAASIALVSNVFFLISTNFGERLLYLPSVMACYLAADLALRAVKHADAGTLAPLRSPLIAAPALLIVAIAGLAVTLRAQDWASQLTLFTADVRTYPNSARLNDFAGSLHYFAGTQLMGHGDMPPAASTAFAEAVTYLTRAVAIRGSFVDIDAPLGMAEYRLGQYETAVPHLEQALAFTDYRDEALEMMADSLEQLHQPGRAIDLFKQIDAEGILDPPAWFALGNDAASRGDDAASIQYFRKFLAATPDNVAAHFNIGRAQNRLGDYAASLASAERCVALAGTPRVQADCLLLEADDFVRTGRRDEAMAAFEKARAIDPTNPLIKR